MAEFADDKITKCLAKVKARRYYEVPSDMDYPEWKKKYGGTVIDVRKTGASQYVYLNKR